MLSPAWNIHRLASNTPFPNLFINKKAEIQTQEQIHRLSKKDRVSIKEDCVSEIAEAKEYTFIYSEAILLLNLIECGSASSLKRQLRAMGPCSAASFWPMSSVVLFWGMSILHQVHAAVQPAKISSWLPLG